MEIIYKNHEGEKVHFSKWPIMIFDPAVLFDNEWSYLCATTTGITGFYKQTKAKEIILQIFADSKDEFTNIMEKMMEAFEKDIKAEKPGEIWIGNYYLECFVISNTYEEYEELYDSVDKKITIVAPKLAWIKEHTVEFRYEEIPKDTSGKGYPYGYDYDYSRSVGYDSSMDNDVFSDMNFEMIIYGYADMPEISIAGNIYKLNCTIQEGEYVVIDSMKRTILLAKANGVVVNLFKYRDDNNIFKKIPPGEVPVYWNGSFDFDILLKEERSEPLWT